MEGLSLLPAHRLMTHYTPSTGDPSLIQETLPWETAGREAWQQRPLLSTGRPCCVSPRGMVVGTGDKRATFLGKDALTGSSRRKPQGMTVNMTLHAHEWACQALFLKSQTWAGPGKE